MNECKAITRPFSDTLFSTFYFQALHRQLNVHMDEIIVWLMPENSVMTLLTSCHNIMVLECPQTRRWHIACIQANPPYFFLFYLTCAISCASLSCNRLRTVQSLSLHIVNFTIMIFGGSRLWHLVLKNKLSDLILGQVQ